MEESGGFPSLDVWEQRPGRGLESQCPLPPCCSLGSTGICLGLAGPLEGNAGLPGPSGPGAALGKTSSFCPAAGSSTGRHGSSSHHPGLRTQPELALCRGWHRCRLCFLPEQVVRRHILGSIVQSEGSYVESLKRVLQVGLRGVWREGRGDPGGTFYKER